MSPHPDQIRPLLRTFDFPTLFTQRLGWDRLKATPLSVPIGTEFYTLQPVAEKRGIVALVCTPTTGGIPNRPTRLLIDRVVTKTYHRHLLIFVDAPRTTQVWQWLAREEDGRRRPFAHTYHMDQPGKSLIQKLLALRFTLEQEEDLTHLEAVNQIEQALRVDRITKRFYDAFKREHEAFLGFIDGITQQADREWYASVMLNRLMFVYFIQKQGFLDNDRDYLTNRLNQVRQKGADKFHSFYRLFLRRLFHEGLGKPKDKRAADLVKLVGNVPYLNGGIFDEHELELMNTGLHIPDEAFERIFGFFDQYQWHLDDRPLANDREINPDVLGYIFEKYINQKQMGAYYTKEDITEYIARNTIVPFLLDATARACPDHFQPAGPAWGLLRNDPDAYLFEAVRHGVDLELPKNIAAGLEDVDQRTDWNKPAAAGFALPTETWREHVARRRRCLDIRQKLRAGEIHAVNDLITYNLDIRRFAEDVLRTCEDPAPLWAFWQALTKVSVLDPTCGSGAFLFAALNVLAPLYDACLDRMLEFQEGTDNADFGIVIDQIQAHPNRRYFVLKSIIIQNLYGVDIMREAVEICKLRLFLKLVAQVQRVEQLEPLPDIDFNVRAGNTLVGYMTLADVEKAMRAWLNFDEEQIRMLKGELRLADEAFQLFRRAQLTQGKAAGDFVFAKASLRKQLTHLREQLNRYLAWEYDVEIDKPKKLAAWKNSHQPFHWFAEFFGIMSGGGGFDAIIGNPPWKEYAAVKKDYAVLNYITEGCGNLHNLCTERSLRIRSSGGRMSFIVQLPLVSSSRMKAARKFLNERSSALFVIPFDDRPGKLFDGLQHCRSVIFLSQQGGENEKHALFTTRYQRWPTQARPSLFQLIEYAPFHGVSLFAEAFPKYANILQDSLFRRIKKVGNRGISHYLTSQKTNSYLFYQEATQYWAKATFGLPYYSKNGVVGSPAHGRYLFSSKPETVHTACAILNSSLFYAFFIAYSDCFHLSDGLASSFPVNDAIVEDLALVELNKNLMQSLRENAERKTINTRDGDRITYDEFFASRSKPIIDDIDRVLAKHYGFTPEELDFIINYDIKYRLGQEEADEE